MQRRLFVAVVPPESVINEIDAEVAKLELLFAGEPVRFLRPETWHITLTFLGSQNDEAIGEIVYALEEAAHDKEPFATRFAELLYGPPGKPPRMLWLGTDRESTAWLGELKWQLDHALRNRAVVIHETERRFAGHLTLARFDGVVRAHPALALSRPITFETRSLDLIESFTERDGARYDCLCKVPLVGIQ